MCYATIFEQVDGGRKKERGKKSLGSGHKTVAIKPEEEIRERGTQDYIVNLKQGKKEKRENRVRVNAVLCHNS